MKLQSLLSAKKMTQAHLASLLGKSQQCISKWINKKCKPQLEMITKLALALECTELEIFNCFITK